MIILTSGITSAGFNFFLPLRQNNINATIITTNIAKETAATKIVSVGFVSVTNKTYKQRIKEIFKQLIKYNQTIELTCEYKIENGTKNTRVL